MVSTCGTIEGRLLAVLDVLGTGVYHNTFSERGKRQTEEVHRFKQAIRAESQREPLHRFCTDLFEGIRSCIAQPAVSSDVRREKSYKLFYEKRNGDLKKLWNDFHVVLQLSQPDPIWTQTVNRLLFNEALVASIGEDARQQPEVSSASLPSVELGADEENTIRYMAGYVPFKLMKVYETKDTQEDANVLDCLSAMAVFGPVDDFYSYTQEWIKNVNRGGLFEVSTATFTFFRQLEILMRGMLPHYLLGGSVSKEDVHDRISRDEGLLCYWNVLSGQLSHDKARVLLKEIIDLWLTIRSHAFAKQLMEQHKVDKKKVTKKSSALRKQMQ